MTVLLCRSLSSTGGVPALPMSTLPSDPFFLGAETSPHDIKTKPGFGSFHLQAGFIVVKSFIEYTKILQTSELLPIIFFVG